MPAISQFSAIEYHRASAVKQAEYNEYCYAKDHHEGWWSGHTVRPDADIYPIGYIEGWINQRKFAGLPYNSNRPLT